MLGRLHFHLAYVLGYRHIAYEDVRHVLLSELKLQPLGRKEKRDYLVFADRSAYFYKNKIILAVRRAVRVSSFRCFLDAALYLIRHFRYYFHCLSKILAAPLPCYYFPVYLARCHVVSFRYIIPEKPFVIAEILVYLAAVVSDPHFAVFRGPQRAGVVVDVRIDFYRSRRVTVLLQYLADGRSGYALADSRYNAADNDNNFHGETSAKKFRENRKNIFLSVVFSIGSNQTLTYKKPFSE